MITTFRKWESYLGNDDTNRYTFPFKITDPKELMIVQIDVTADPAVVDWIERGDVGVNVFEVEFDSVLGGGTVVFEDNLPANKRLYIKLANDEVTQPTQFREQQDFKLRSFENALDFIVTQVTRLVEKQQRSVKFADHFSHVESVVNLEIQTFPVARGIPIMDDEVLQMEMLTAYQIIEREGVFELIQTAQDAADAAQSDVDALEPRVDQLELDIVNFNQDIADLQDVDDDLQDQIDALDLRTDALEAGTVDQDADIADLQMIVADHENRITNLELAAGGSGGAGGSFEWFSPTGGAIKEEQNLFQVFHFYPLAENTLRAVLVRPSDLASTSVPKTLQIGWQGVNAGENVKWTLSSRLVKPGTAFNDSSLENTFSTEITVVAGVQHTLLEVSDGAGKIAGTDIEPNDMIVLTLTRANAAGVEDSVTVFIPELTQPSMK